MGALQTVVLRRDRPVRIGLIGRRSAVSLVGLVVLEGLVRVAVRGPSQNADEVVVACKRGPVAGLERT